MLSREMTMGSVQRTVVCVKQGKQDIRQEEWDETMLLPGDIIIGVAEVDDERFFVQINSKSELRSQLERLNRQVDGEIWVKIRRGNNIVKLRASIVTYRRSTFQRRFTIRTASDNKDLAVLGDLTLQQCTELQELSRKVVNLDNRGFNKKGVKYEWKQKADTYLPDPKSTVISSILFMPMPDEHSVEATTARSMAWFSAAVSSGVPLVFVNIQTEQIVASEKNRSSGREKNYNNAIQIVNGIRLWFLPGIAEVIIVLKLEPGETRLGMDIRRTEEGFICIYSVTKGSAADRAGLGRLQKEASETGHLVVISRLEGKSVIPSTVSSTDTGLVHCCDIDELKGTIASAMDEMNELNLHVMGWPAPKAPPTAPPAICSTVATLMTPGPN
ncbi:hypothetical protein BVC80_209g108 [Macleaya cordata]|uniref:PDZ domain n=1 Tax=Macleaya cordata TaxID=56857 RepID=A0A200QDB8_MACCD|nr:hypothetical protein BVC80_209g108 [Macleaya cordata]